MEEQEEAEHLNESVADGVAAFDDVDVAAAEQPAEVSTEKSLNL